MLLIPQAPTPPALAAVLLAALIGCGDFHMHGKIVFASNGEDLSETHIWVMNADGSGIPDRLTKNVAGWERSPDVSPDGLTIVFASTRDGNWQIYAIKADGSGQIRLTNNAAIDDHPRWSPDGRKIVFSSDRDGDGSHIFVINPDGSAQVRLTQGPVTDREPDWSPDGTRIVFVHDGNIAVMNADGTGLTNLTNLTNFSIFNSNSSPAWSPSGQKIAYASASDHRIYLMSADGSNPSPLVTTADQQYGPAWSPDGAQIAFAQIGDCFCPGFNCRSCALIYIVNVDGTALIGFAGGLEPAWSPP